MQLQRPGADDVMVLKKELVSVQTLMDQMTLESEEKGKEVEKERERLQMLLDEARTQAEEVQKDFDAYKVSFEDDLISFFFTTILTKDDEFFNYYTNLHKIDNSFEISRQDFQKQVKSQFSCGIITYIMLLFIQLCIILFFFVCYISANKIVFIY